MRYIEQGSQDKKPEPKKKERVMTKPGSYSSKQLEATKDRPFRGGSYNGGR